MEKGDIVTVLHSASGKAVGKQLQLIEKSSEKDASFMWLARSFEPLETVGGTKETLVWIPEDWIELYEGTIQ